MHLPVAELQKLILHSPDGGGQVTAVPVQMPLLHTSVSVHESLSVQVVPSALGTPTHLPL